MGLNRFCLDITHGQSPRDTYSIMSLSDWSDICVHGLNMTRCIERYENQLQADQWRPWALSFSDWFIRCRSLAPALTATCSLFPCMSVDHAWWQCWCTCDSTRYKMKTIQELAFIYTRQYHHSPMPLSKLIFIYKRKSIQFSFLFRLDVLTVRIITTWKHQLV